MDNYLQKNESKYKGLLSVIKVGEDVKIEYSLQPSTATKTKVTWKSSNPKVATVNSSGVVKGIGEGTATITVTSESKKTATATIKVTKKEDTEKKTETNETK